MSSTSPINWPIAIALLLLIGFVAAMRFGLDQVFQAWGFWTYIAVCLTGGCLFIAAAFAYDARASRSRRSPPPGRNDHPS